MILSSNQEELVSEALQEFSKEKVSSRALVFPIRVMLILVSESYIQFASLHQRHWAWFHNDQRSTIYP